MRFLFLTCAHHLSHVCLVAIAGAAQPARRINNPRWRRDAAPQRAPPNTCPLTQSTQNYTQNTHKKHTYRSQTDHIQRTDSVDRNDLSTQLTQLTRLCTIDASFRSKRSNARRKTCCPTRAELEWYNTLTHPPMGITPHIYNPVGACSDEAATLRDAFHLRHSYSETAADDEAQ